MAPPFETLDIYSEMEGLDKLDGWSSSALSAPGGVIPLEHRTLTDGPPQGVPVYPHGFSSRYQLLTAGSVESVLERAGFSARRYWTKSVHRDGSVRYVARGSAWITGRAPGGRRSRPAPLARMNRQWHTRLYSVSFEQRAGNLYLDIQGVRSFDVAAFIERVLGLGTSEYVLAHHRVAERYIVVSAAEGRRLAEALSGTEARGGGRLSRKRFLLRDQPVPVTIRTRSRAVATLNIYRIERGATSAVKVEIRLAGKTSQRGQFHNEDIAKLEEALVRVVVAHGVRALYKPARWEPREREAFAERHRDEALASLPASAYRGKRVPLSARIEIPDCHPPQAAKTEDPLALSVSYRFPSRIRTNCSAEGHADPQLLVNLELVERASSGVTVYGSQQGLAPRLAPYCRKGGPWTAVVDEIANVGGGLFEIVLDGSRDPGALLQALARRFQDRLGLEILALTPEQTWEAARWMRCVHPLVDDTDVVVLVVDVSVRSLLCLDDFGGGDANLEDVFADIDGWNHAPGAVDYGETMGRMLASLCESLRELAEKHDVPIILISEDARPGRGRGPMQRHHIWSDVRVRSTLGDAARYACHVRFLAETDGRDRVWRVVTTKDEAEGVGGRILFEQGYLEASSDRESRFHGRRRRRRRKKNKPDETLRSMLHARRSERLPRRRNRPPSQSSGRSARRRTSRAGPG